MGERWSINQYGGITRDGCFLAHNEIPVTANADCDAYEARIAELKAKLDWAQQIVKAQSETSNGVACAEERAAGNGGCGACSWCCSQWRKQAESAQRELARVKAESLRVVEVDDDGKLYDWYMTPTGLGYPGKDRKQNNCIESAEGYHRLDECKPVRLERWEMEDGN